MIDLTDAIYVENETKLQWPIRLGRSMMKTKQDN